MRLRTLFLLIAVTALLALPAMAQNPTGTLTGTVTDGKDALPGVTVTVASPNLQGRRIAVTSINGDYIFRFLPPGEYEVRFELQGFQTIDTTVKVSAAQTSKLDATMPQATVAEEVTVTGAYETVSTNSTASTTYEAGLIEKLPVARNIAGAVTLTPGVHATGPSGNPSISGAMSYENLYMINGVVVNENLRGQPVNTYIEDAIQETTTSVAGVSAEYGRFAGGVVNVLTKSGGNEVHGSLRLSLDKDKWTEKSPMTKYGSQSDVLNKTYEATIGGFLMKDKLWYFVAGRYRQDTSTFQTYKTLIPVQRVNTDQRVEGKLTFSATPNHRFIVSSVTLSTPQKNYVFTSGAVDLTQFYDRNVPNSILAVNYNGVITENLFMEAQYSTRKLEFQKSGSRYTDMIKGTPIYDRNSSGQGNSPTFCGVCKPNETRDNKDYLLKGSYFLSTAATGSHDIVVGFDRFQDLHRSDNHQSGSDWQIRARGFNYLGTTWWPTVNTATSAGSAGTLIYWWPILEKSKGSEFTTDSLFINDRWRLSNKLTFTVGFRYDKNDGKNAWGKKVSDDSKVSPRLGLNWDPKGDGSWTFSASYAHYVTALLNSGNIADVSPAGSPAAIVWGYTGPTLDTANMTNEQTVAKVFEWFNNSYCDKDGKCGKANMTNVRSVSFPGYNRIIERSLASPYAKDITVGMVKRFGTNALLRVDYTHREFADLYETRLLQSYGTVTLDLLGVNWGKQDLGKIYNSSYFERNYDGVNLQGNWRLGDFSIGGNWTWSHAYGNYNGEGASTGPVRGSNPLLYYPEYVDVKWNDPRRDLSVDQRNNARLWVVWDMLNTKHNRASLSVMHTYYTGDQLGNTIGVDTRPLVKGTTYITPPTAVTYWTDKIGTWKLKDINRTDFSVNYSFVVPALGKDFELYVQPEIINVFNHRSVIGVNQTTYDATGGYTQFKTFNPWTEKPIECPQSYTSDQCKAGTYHYQKGPDYLKPTGTGSYQTGRQYRVSLGIRF